MTLNAVLHTRANATQADVDRLAARWATEIRGVLAGEYTYDESLGDFRPPFTCPEAGRCDCNEIDPATGYRCNACEWTPEQLTDFEFWASNQLLVDMPSLDDDPVPCAIVWLTSNRSFGAAAEGNHVTAWAHGTKFSSQVRVEGLVDALADFAWAGGPLELGNYNQA